MLSSQGGHCGSKLSQELEAAGQLLLQVKQRDKPFRGKACNGNILAGLKGPGWQGGGGVGIERLTAQAHKETAMQGPWQMHLLG